MKKNSWYNLAKYCEETYGVLVDYEEEFFICPHCDEPIYADDWDAEDFIIDGIACCPICEEPLIEEE